MTCSREPTRRGVALLIVLATVVVVSTASVSLLRSAVTARVGREFARNTAAADDLLDATEAPIRHWLTTMSGQVVLAPDIDAPRVEVLHDAWRIAGVTYELRINAWDQCGMVPATVARSGSPLHLCLPTRVRRLIDQTDLPSGQSLGLDSLLAVSPTGEPTPVFPTAPVSPPAWFGAGAESRGELSAPSGDAGPEAVGALLATHNDNVINVNTAPVEPLQAALRAAGRGGIEAIVAVRAQGRGAVPGNLPTVGQSASRAPRIAGASNAWAIRVDVRIGSVRRSWWSVYVKRRSNRWECAQRLAIPE